MVHSAIVIPTSAYGANTWKVHWKHVKSLEQYNQCCRRKILQIKPNDICANISVVIQSNTTSTEATIIWQQLHRSGHVRMTNWRLPKQSMLCIWWTSGVYQCTKKALQGCPRMKPRKVTLTGTWETKAADTFAWRKQITEGTVDFEASRQ